MDTLEIFGIQFLMSLIVYGMFAKWYVAPWLSQKSFNQALIVLIAPHAIRHLGLTFLVPGVVEPSIPVFFANTVAYGDFISGLLALLALIALRGSWRLTLPIVWVFNIVGMIDLINALRQADAVPFLGATWYIPTFWVPILLITHVMIFSRLLQSNSQNYQASGSPEH